MSAYEFGRLINQFFVSATEILVKTHGWVDQLVGDQVIGLFVPGFAGPDHARCGVQAGLELLLALGHDQPGRSRLPVGVGVNIAVAFVGAVGTTDGATDTTVLGDAADTTARLSSMAGQGEILVGEPTVRAAGLDPSRQEVRSLELKGKSKPVIAPVLMVGDMDLLTLA